MKSSNISSSRNNLLTTTPQTKVNPAMPSMKVSGIEDSSEFKRHKMSYQLAVRPNLIAELADSHRLSSHFLLAQIGLKKILHSILKMKQIIEKGNYSPESLNELDRHKKSVLNTVSSKMFGEYIFDSTFYPKLGTPPTIEFSVPGLDLQRERLSDELITLYINNKMIPLAFDRTESLQTLQRRFSMMFGYSQMTMRVDQKNIVIGIKDEIWRQWDAKIYVSGQGARFPSGQPLTVSVNTLLPTYDLVIGLDVKDSDNIVSINKVERHIQQVYKELVQSMSEFDKKCTDLIGLCLPADATKEPISSIFQNPAASLMSINRQYLQLNKRNVVSLLNSH